MACGPAACSGVQNIGQGGGTHVGEEVFGTAYGILGKFVQTDQYVIDTVRSEGYADSRSVAEAEDAGEVIVAASSADASYGEVQGLDFEDGSGVIVKAAGQG